MTCVFLSTSALSRRVVRSRSTRDLKGETLRFEEDGFVKVFMGLDGKETPNLPKILQKQCPRKDKAAGTALGSNRPWAEGLQGIEERRAAEKHGAWREAQGQKLLR